MKIRFPSVVILLLAVSGGAMADDLTGANRILCAGVQATTCDSSGACEVGMPWQWNMPEFVEIDLEAKDYLVKF